MKRSRTCLNLVELDVPAAPKRTCSLPNLAWRGDHSFMPVRGRQQNHRESLLFSHLAQGSGFRFPAAVTANEGSFVVGSIVPTMGSLHEITIVEGQQFIGEESSNSETAAAGAAEGVLAQQCPAPSAGSPVSLFGGAVHGSLFMDCGDSGDYFFGPDSSSDEADEGCGDPAAAATTAASPAEPVEAVARNGNGNGNEAVCAAGQVSDTESNMSCPRQISDVSSSSSNSNSSSSGSCYGGGRCSFEEYAIVCASTEACAGTAAVVTTATATVKPSLLTAAAQPLGDDSPSACNSAHARAVSPPPPPPLVLSGGSWRSPSAGGPRVSVRVCSPRVGGGGGGAVDRRRQSRRSRTVPASWPFAVPPHSASATKDCTDESATTTRGGNWGRRQLQRRRRGDGDSDNEDGSLVPAAGVGSGDEKVLMGMDRLRLFDPEMASSY